ncbi:DUF2497 domain-containing protein [Acuticoccus yangtzensis]|uniref:DUF2497 domain-containing protein n=1 Tax=Acuticoccus yangtzensis TaxID=1443441 RepID=UPI001B3BDB7D|nr:DUF2497 domain-containing protein [Acuticoccus yangtzensis]
MPAEDGDDAGPLICPPESSGPDWASGDDGLDDLEVRSPLALSGPGSRQSVQSPPRLRALPAPEADDEAAVWGEAEAADETFPDDPLPDDCFSDDSFPDDAVTDDEVAEYMAAEDDGPADEADEGWYAPWAAADTAENEDVRADEADEEPAAFDSPNGEAPESADDSGWTAHADETPRVRPVEAVEEAGDEGADGVLSEPDIAELPPQPQRKLPLTVAARRIADALRSSARAAKAEPEFDVADIPPRRGAPMPSVASVPPADEGTSGTVVSEPAPPSRANKDAAACESGAAGEEASAFADTAATPSLSTDTHAPVLQGEKLALGEDLALSEDGATRGDLTTREHLSIGEDLEPGEDMSLGEEQSPSEGVGGGAAADGMIDGEDPRAGALGTAYGPIAIADFSEHLGLIEEEDLADEFLPRPAAAAERVDEVSAQAPAPRGQTASPLAQAISIWPDMRSLAPRTVRADAGRLPAAPVASSPAPSAPAQSPPQPAPQHRHDEGRSEAPMPLRTGGQEVWPQMLSPSARAAFHRWSDAAPGAQPRPSATESPSAKRSWERQQAGDAAQADRAHPPAELRQTAATSTLEAEPQRPGGWDRVRDAAQRPTFQAMAERMKNAASAARASTGEAPAGGASSRHGAQGPAPLGGRAAAPVTRRPAPKDRAPERTPLRDTAFTRDQTPPMEATDLMSQTTRLAAGAAFEELSRSLQARDGAEPSRGTNPLEDLVKEAMRPMLREWLDANLNGIVERLVREEIQKVTGRR